MSEPEPEYVKLKDNLINHMACKKKMSLGLFKSIFDHIQSRTFFSSNWKFKLECGLFKENGIIAINFQNLEDLLNGTDHKFNHCNLKNYLSKLGYKKIFTSGNLFNEVRNILSHDISSKIDKKWLFYYENEHDIQEICHEDPMEIPIPLKYPVIGLPLLNVNSISLFSEMKAKPSTTQSNNFHEAMIAQFSRKKSTKI